MGIVNITPDSFSGHGNSADPKTVLAHAAQLVQTGTDILDLGAESTRPGAKPLPAAEEWQRLVPVLVEVLRWGLPISVDTYHAETMRRALAAGADIVNDVWALRQPGAVDAIVAHPNCGVCLMHMHGKPETMQIKPMAAEALAVVAAFLRARAQTLLDLGVAAERICLDPGIGFGKTAEQNFCLLRDQSALAALGFPLLVGWSRKSSLGKVTGLGPDQRMLPSVVVALLAAQNGAQILRVHDVAQTRTALQIWHAAQCPQTLSKLQ